MNATAAVVRDAQHCANLFRFGRDVEASLEMVELIDAAMPLFTQRPAQAQLQWAHVLSSILACQERQDWIGVADWLEVEFVAVLAAQ